MSQASKNLENDFWDDEVSFKLREAEREEELTEYRYSSKEVLTAMLEVIGGEGLS